MKDQTQPQGWSNCSACPSLALLLNAPRFIRRTPPMFPRLVDDGGCQQLRRIELADRETFEPGFMTAGQAVELRPTNVPKLDVDAVRAALAEQQDRHDGSLAGGRTKGKTMADLCQKSHSVIRGRRPSRPCPRAVRRTSNVGDGCPRSTRGTRTGRRAPASSTGIQPSSLS
jgi:hypothetical protein